MNETVSLNNRQIRARRLLGCLLLLLLLQGTTTADGRSPEQVVQIFQSELIAAASDPSLKYQQRFDLLQTAISESHDFDRISQLLTGRQWRSLEPHQQDQFRRSFEHLTVALYASRFHDYHGTGFSFVAQNTLPRGMESVRTTLDGSDNQAIPFQYLLWENDAGWRIINTIVDNVSDLALRRTRYNRILKQSGFDALLEYIDQEIARLATTADGE